MKSSQVKPLVDGPSFLVGCEAYQKPLDDPMIPLIFNRFPGPYLIQPPKKPTPDRLLCMGLQWHSRSQCPQWESHFSSLKIVLSPSTPGLISLEIWPSKMPWPWHEMFHRFMGPFTKKSIPIAPIISHKRAPRPKRETAALPWLIHSLSLIISMSYFIL